MTLRRLPDEDPQNLTDPAYRRRRIIMQNMRDEELAIAQVEEMQAVSAAAFVYKLGDWFARDTRNFFELEGIYKKQLVRIRL